MDLLVRPGRQRSRSKRRITIRKRIKSRRKSKSRTGKGGLRVRSYSCSYS
jgi:hypothetical protein